MLDTFRSYLAWRRFQASIRKEIAAARVDHKPIRNTRQRQRDILHAALEAGEANKRLIRAERAYDEARA